MAKDKGVTIVIKKIQGGAPAPHGGAWKVAYADFVTAMMAFFLVMWLLGADEETIQSVSHYFNHPNTPYNQGKDPDSKTESPLGEKFGQGDTILNGADGGVPADLVQRPLRDLKEEVEQKLGDVAFGLEFNGDVEVLKFSILGDDLFAPGSAKVRKDAYPYLDRLARIFNKLQGSVLIEGHLDKQSNTKGQDPYLFSTERAIAVMKYFVSRHGIDEDRFCPRGVAARRAWTTSGTEGRAVASHDTRNRRVEFTLSPSNACTR